MADQITIDRAVVQQALDALENCSSEYGHRCNRCDSEVDEGGKVASALRAALAQAEPVQFNPAEALRLAEEFAQMKQAHGVFCNADSRRLMEEARRALAAYLLGIKEDGND